MLISIMLLWFAVGCVAVAGAIVDNNMDVTIFDILDMECIGWDAIVIVVALFIAIIWPCSTQVYHVAARKMTETMEKL